MARKKQHGIAFGNKQVSGRDMAKSAVGTRIRSSLERGDCLQLKRRRLTICDICHGLDSGNCQLSLNEVLYYTLERGFRPRSYPKGSLE